MERSGNKRVGTQVQAMGAFSLTEVIMAKDVALLLAVLAATREPRRAARRAA